MSYIDQLPKVRYDLAYHIGQYKRGFLRRNVVTEAVCDAIEGFCEYVCKHDGGMVVYNGLCSWCGKRVVESYDILEG